MISRHTHQTSVRYLLPSTKRDLDNRAFDNAMEQFYELASEYENCPTLDTLIANTKTPEQMFKQSPTLIYDSGWKDVKDG